MLIINLTQHAASPKQLEAGVVEPRPEHKSLIREALTFDSAPSGVEIRERATKLALLASTEAGPRAACAMIGGAPYLMGALESALRAADVKPIYAFSTRESVDQAQADGSIRKVAVFRHAGFVDPAA